MLTAGVVRWEQPPPAARRGNNALMTEAARRAASELREQPGAWGVVVEGAGARVLVTRIRQGLDLAWQPAGAYEAVCRTVDGRITIYARYVGLEE
ncbi:hypothetical protein ABGB16_05700 [Micromonospora sp. B11E3]|uniref:hypothetical protein n=1 Tax=Micromonospora sp. B11E3 TaxID=3153562 RepID=UPI00325F7738